MKGLTEYINESLISESSKKYAAETISVELIKRMVDSLDKKLNGSSLKKEVTKDSKSLNKSLKGDFDQLTGILQSVVDSQYYDNYVVDSYMPFFKEDIETAKKHNISLLNSMKKVLKFID